MFKPTLYCDKRIGFKLSGYTSHVFILVWIANIARRKPNLSSTARDH